MSDHITNISEKAGLPPGTLIHVGEQKEAKVKITVFDFNASEYSETECQKVDDCFNYKDKKDSVSWIKVVGLHDPEIIAAIGNHFELHPLVQEEILNTKHRPKFEDFENYLFLTLKKLRIRKKQYSLSTEQISLVLGQNWLISFHEQDSEIFNQIHKRLKEKNTLLFKRGADYFLYRLIDIVVDHYYLISERISLATEKLEQSILEDPNNETLYKIQRLKKMLLAFRKAVSPLREAVSLLQKENTQLIHKNKQRYFQDVYEHIIQIREFVESQRDILAGLMDLYLSGVSNKMNQVMQVLTIIATIFIPLTFLAGIYGMNFDNMPELHWKYGYFIMWGLMILIGGFLILLFKRRRWL